jgi:hypothetical protein
VKVVFTEENRKMAVPKSEKETWLIYTIQPFARLLFDTVSFVQILVSIKLARLRALKLYEVPFIVHLNTIN